MNGPSHLGRPLGWIVGQTQWSAFSSLHQESPLSRESACSQSKSFAREGYNPRGIQLLGKVEKTSLATERWLSFRSRGLGKLKPQTCQES